MCVKSTMKKVNEAKLKRDKQQKDELQKQNEEKVKRTSYNTPRNYVPKTSTADIYGHNKKDSTHSARAPKKSLSNTSKTSNESPMKGIIQSSPSSTSYTSSIRDKNKIAVQKKKESKASPRSSGTVKDFNVTVNSAVVKRRLNLDKEKSFTRVSSKKLTDSPKIISKVESKRATLEIGNEKQRTKTRTLNEDEVKILTHETVDNNLEMLNLTRKLTAAPKAYFIDLEDSKAKKIELKQSRPKTPSDEEVSYEDDFESYESDFDSYHSSSPSEQNCSDDKSEGDDDGASSAGAESREIINEERMLDSGSFHLRDQRSATKTTPALDFILEKAEGAEDKPTSLTDEGFMEMSSSSAVSSIKTVQTDVIDRPLFIDFTKSQQNKRKKKINDRLKQRAKDLFSVITLHEMSYSLFEMKPISYDLYMATFGKSNYRQIAVQTFDDGITEEIQTEDVEYENKWTQHPLEFSKSDICVIDDVNILKNNKKIEDYAAKFTYLTSYPLNVHTKMNINENYKRDPLIIYLEQKDGVGRTEMLPYEIYKAKLKKNDCNTHRLSKFLKRVERRIYNVLNSNSGESDLSELKMSKYSFSKGYIPISTQNITDQKYEFLNKTNISQVYISETKNNLILTVHNKLNTAIKKCMICLWDISVTRREPSKILTAIDNIALGRYKGVTDGIFVAALEDGSIHLWDLSEEPRWRYDVASADKSNNLVEIHENEMTPLERDREWNKKNSQVGVEDSKIYCALQSCAFTNSAYNMNYGDASSFIVGLEFTGNQVISEESKRIIGQVAALENIGILTIWSIIQEKSKIVLPDIGKAYWSKMKLEKNQLINLLEHIDLPIVDNKIDFNLNSAKRRINSRRQEKIALKINNSRLKSAVDSDRQRSAVGAKNKIKLPAQKDVSWNWETGILCYDLKAFFWQNTDNYLIAKNCGEVLCCKKVLGAVRVSRFCIATDLSSIISIEVSPHKLPYYLVATDTGTISVCSLIENRVLRTLDCRNIPTQESERCLSDHRGRYISSVTTTSSVVDTSKMDTKRVSSLCWSRVNPCCIFVSLDRRIVNWDLCHSDIYAKCANDDAALSCVAGDGTLALVTPEGEVHIHKLTNETKTKDYLLLFEKYMSLL